MNLSTIYRIELSVLAGHWSLLLFRIVSNCVVSAIFRLETNGLYHDKLRCFSTLDSRSLILLCYLIVKLSHNRGWEIISLSGRSLPTVHRCHDADLPI